MAEKSHGIVKEKAWKDTVIVAIKSSFGVQMTEADYDRELRAINRAVNADKKAQLLYNAMHASQLQNRQPLEAELLKQRTKRRKKDIETQLAALPLPSPPQVDSVLSARLSLSRLKEERKKAYDEAKQKIKEQLKPRALLEQGGREANAYNISTEPLVESSEPSASSQPSAGEIENINPQTEQSFKIKRKSIMFKEAGVLASRQRALDEVNTTKRDANIAFAQMCSTITTYLQKRMEREEQNSNNSTNTSSHNINNDNIYSTNYEEEEQEEEFED